jgi:hypothetical protein
VVAIEDTLPLNVENYPTIKFWYKQQRRKETTRCRKLEQPNSRHDSQDENVYFWFLQNVDGMVVDSDVVTSLWAEAKVIWTGMCDKYGPMGLPWSSVPAKRRLEFWLKLERVYPFLRLCTNHYKANAVATRDYTHWYKAQFSPTRALHSSLQKRGRVTKPVRVRKSRRSSSLLCRVSWPHIEDDNEDDDVVEAEVEVQEESVDDDDDDEDQVDAEDENEDDGKEDEEEEAHANYEDEEVDADADMDAIPLPFLNRTRVTPISTTKSPSTVHDVATVRASLSTFFSFWY